PRAGAPAHAARQGRLPDLARASARCVRWRGAARDPAHAGWPHPRRPVLSAGGGLVTDRKSTRLNSSHVSISYAVFCLKKKQDSDFPVLPDLADRSGKFRPLLGRDGLAGARRTESVDKWPVPRGLRPPCPQALTWFARA